MPYTLSPRQERAFTDTCDIYAPAPLTDDADDVVDNAMAVTTTPVATSVRCHRTPRYDGSHPEVIGRTNADMLDTTDRFKFHENETVGPNYVIKLTTSGHPESGQFFRAMGEAKVNNWRAHERAILAKKLEVAPPGVAI